MAKGSIGRDALIIATLRKALKEQINENEILRPLAIEHARLQQEVQIYRKFLGKNSDGAKLAAREVCLARARPVPPLPVRRRGTHMRSKILTESEAEDSSYTLSATCHGKKYLYRNGEPVRDLDREKPSYMQATVATKSKQKPMRKSNFRGWTVQSGEIFISTGEDSWEEQLGNKPLRRRIDKWRLSQETCSASAAWERSPTPDSDLANWEGELPTKDLGEGPREMHIHSAAGHGLVSRALQLLKEGFHQVARVHWPGLYQEVEQGPHLVGLCKFEVDRYLERYIGVQSLKTLSPNPTLLRETLLERVSSVRNALAHPHQSRFSYCTFLEADLFHIQVALQLMCDHDRAKGVQELRCQLKAEAEKPWFALLTYENAVVMPFYGLDQGEFEVENVTK